MSELRRLLDAATPGPWDSGGLPIGDGPLPQPAYVFGPDGDSFVEVHWNAGRDSDPYADAALIVALRNAADDLLAVVEAARVVADQMVQDGGGDRWWKAHDALREAIERLGERA